MADARTTGVHHRIADPAFRWPTGGWWCTAIGAVISVAFFLVPSFTQLPLLTRLLVCVALIFAPAVVLFLRHIWRLDRVFARRAGAYGAVVTTLDEANLELDRAGALISKLLRERQEKNGLRIAYCYVFDGKPLIALKGKRGLSVNVGDPFTVVDLVVGRILGTFDVTEDTGGYYVACCSGEMDALWFGYMKQAGSARSEPPPGALAIRFPVEGDADDRENTENQT